MVREARGKPRSEPDGPAPEPLQDRHAEMATIGGCLLSIDALDDALEHLQPEHFGEFDLRVIFDTMQAMRHEGKAAIDSVTVAERIHADGNWKAAGGASAILAACEAVPNAHHTRHYAEIVRDKFRRRTAFHVAWRLRERLAEPGLDTDALLAEAEQDLHGALDDTAKSGATDISTILVDALAGLGNPNRCRDVTTGFTSLDEACGGFPAGGITIIGARPSTGKSALVTGSCVRVAEAGVPTLLVSLEMPRMEVATRVVASRANIAFTKIHKGYTTPQENETIVREAAMLNKMPLFIDDSIPAEHQLAAMIRRMVRAKKIQLVVIDYLQLIEPSDSKVPREQQVAKITRGMKRLAMQLKIAIVLLSQLNREVESRECKRPKLSDLRESGAIEQDADLVWMLWRPGLHDSSKQDDHAEIVIAKQRNGPLKNVELDWSGATMRFSDRPPTGNWVP